MRLEDLTIALRPRQPWEAVDLGCALVRRDYGRVLAVWAITVFPVWAVLAWLLRGSPVWFVVVVWWLKPLYDRVPLYFLSRAAFGAKPGFGETLRAWPGLWARFFFSSLLWRRLSFIRSYAQPALLLEGLRGRAARERVRVLATEGWMSGFMTSWVFLKFEVAIYLGLWALTSGIAPESGLPDWEDMFVTGALESEMTVAYTWYTNILYLLAITINEPFYVGAGFGLYLNSRTRLEGWDIELTFRRLAARIRSTAAAAALVFLCATAACGAAEAEPPSALSPRVRQAVTASSPSAAGQRILKKPEFKVHVRTDRIWVKEEGVGVDAAWLVHLLTSLGYLFAAGLVGLLVWWLVRHRHLFSPGAAPARKAVSPAAPRVVMGLDITSESLPADVVRAARALFEKGHAREALSLLYRGALSRLVLRHRLHIRDSDTEDDCLLHVAKASARDLAAWFRSLTLLWVRAAYAGVEARAEEFDSLCRTWPFDTAPSAPPTRTRLFQAVAVLVLLLPTGCGGGKWVDTKIPIGYKGRARTDPFLAAQLLLKEHGHRARRLPNLERLPDASTSVLVMSGEAGMPEGRARQIMEWVAQGGHLIYTLAGCRPYNDWSLFNALGSYAYFGNDKRADAVLTSLGVIAHDRRVNTAKILDQIKGKKTPKPAEEDEIKSAEDVPVQEGELQWKWKTFTVGLPNYVTFNLSRELRRDEYTTENPTAATVLSLQQGGGRVTLLNHARPLRNRYLGESDHAELLLALVGSQPRDVSFVLTLETSFWKLLWSRAWMPITGLALLTAFWLWRHMPRFGPLRQVALHDTRHFADHITALGQFYHRLRRDDVLLAAAADAVRTRALRRHPHLRDAGDAALIPLLSQRSGLPAARVESALAPALTRKPWQTVQQLQDLQTLRAAL